MDGRDNRIEREVDGLPEWGDHPYLRRLRLG